jgi:hypothetical protein
LLSTLHYKYIKLSGVSHFCRCEAVRTAAQVPDKTTPKE